MWVRTGELLDFSDWGPGKPDNKPPYNEDCAMFFAYDLDFKWNDLECSVANTEQFANKPICQRKITKVFQNLQIFLLWPHCVGNTEITEQTNNTDTAQSI